MTDWRAMVVELANQFGLDATYLEIIEEYDPVSGTVETTTTEHPVRVLPPQRYDATQLDSSVIEVGDLEVTIPAAEMPLEPSTSHKMQVLGATWNIHRHQKVVIAGQSVRYRLHLQK